MVLTRIFYKKMESIILYFPCEIQLKHMNQKQCRKQSYSVKE